MPGFLRRLIGPFPKHAPPAFDLELPEGWVGGHGSDRLIEALVEYARVHPESHDRVFKLLFPSLKGRPGLFLACTIRGLYADLIVTGDAREPGGLLTVDDELGAWVEGNLEEMTASGALVGDPSISVLQEPYPGRELRWSEQSPHEPLLQVVSWIFVAAGHIWTIDSTVETDVATMDLSAPIESELTSLATLRAIAVSFRLV